jgi:predicted NACHT family NTPase
MGGHPKEIVMTLDILAKIVDTLTGSLVGSTLEQIREKAKRREIVIRTLEAVGLRPDAPPPDFDGVYAYTLVEYGVGKPKPVLDFFRHEFIREAFRKSFEQRERSILDNEAENLLDWSELGEELRQMDYDPRREFAQFAAVFNTLADRTRTVAEVKRDQKLEDVHKTVQEIVARLEKLDELPALRAEMERLHYERYEAELPDTDDVHGEFRVAESLEAQILQILYVYL